MHGAVAQLGEHLPCTQGVESSSLFGSTKRAQERSLVVHGLIAQ